MTQGWEPSGDPRPPMNGQVVSTYVAGQVDVRWDDPSLIASNSQFSIAGVNVYRSDNSDRGPYKRLNEFPVGGGLWRDQTTLAIIRETIEPDQWSNRGDAPNSRRWAFATRQQIYKNVAPTSSNSPVTANSPDDVILYVNGNPVPVHSVSGVNRLVVLQNQVHFDDATEVFDRPVLPTSDSDVVEVVYRSLINFVGTPSAFKLHYRLTTVAYSDASPSGYVETPLDMCPPLALHAVETMDYIWREAIKRNFWILQQGGEAVKVFLKKVSGQVCYCGGDPRTREYTKQPSQLCEICFGSGFVGGYEGPYNIIIGPDDGEVRWEQTPNGRVRNHVYEVFAIPTPILTMRDFIVKQNGERYSVGAVKTPSNRGNILQQHFSISAIPESDIRYKVPIYTSFDPTVPHTFYRHHYYPPMPIDGDFPISPPYVSGPEPTHPPYPDGTPDSSFPMVTEKSGWPAEKQPRGRSPVWENQNE